MHFAIDYTNILCNLAVGRSLLAAQQHTPMALETSSSKKDKNSDSKDDIMEKKEKTVSVTHVTPKQYEEQQSEQIKISVELLSSAIKALESHIESNNRKTGHNNVNSKENEVEVNSLAATNTLIVAPTLGRALGQLGLLYLHPFR